ncbi:hypothetical protein EB796_015999 [Bugula neritina]|uniref:Uncharacterized protein n=1 Tax=Bugula neritina TaxID=10212 RepID=A0A7J7JK55_BUGNE|nr:hypothetical protein EB796_015999 [Bugula neritina]
MSGKKNGVSTYLPPCADILCMCISLCNINFCMSTFILSNNFPAQTAATCMWNIDLHIPILLVIIIK